MITTTPPHSDALLTEVATLAGTVAVRRGHGGELLLALTGRAPLPGGFTVV